MLLEKICKELGVEVGKGWLGNTGEYYMISKSGEVRVWNDEYGQWIESYYDLSHIVTGELKPIWKPKMNEEYWTIGFEREDNIYKTTWWNCNPENEFLRKGLVFKTKEEAEEMASKILEFVKEEI